MEKLLVNIRENKIKEAYRIFENTFYDIKEEFEIETYENPNEDLFKFIIYAGEESENPQIIYFCSMILATSLNYFKDAYKYSHDLARKLAEIEPHNLDNWEWSLFFSDIPDEVMNKKEMEDSIINILKLDNKNKKALDLLNSKFSQSERSIIISKI